MPYKMFNKDLTGKNKFQYEVGKTYELPKNKKIVVFTEGFHYCENPLDCLECYPLLDEDCDENLMCEIEPLGKIQTEYDISVTDKIKIGTKLSLGQFINASFEFIKEKVKESSADEKVIATSERYSQIAIDSCKQVAVSGKISKVVAGGSSNQIATSGDFTQVAVNGDSNTIAMSGEHNQVVTDGDNNRIAISGMCSQVVTKGGYGKITINGDGSQAVANGKNSIIANIGRNGMAKGIKGTWITLAEYKWNDKHTDCIPVYVKSFKVDGKRIKENTFYRLQDKKLLEVK